MGGTTRCILRKASPRPNLVERGASSPHVVHVHLAMGGCAATHACSGQVVGHLPPQNLEVSYSCDASDLAIFSSSRATVNPLVNPLQFGHVCTRLKTVL
eukprot:jgi/Botrbrau1/14022/Bobra.0310s0009.1